MVKAKDVRELLEGYGISSDLVKDKWIDNRINNFVIPWVEKKARQSFQLIKTIIEYYSGTGSGVLMLDRKPIVEIVSIEIVASKDFEFVVNVGSIEILPDEGVIKSIVSEGYSRTFPKGNKNIKVTYKYGFTTAPLDIIEAVTYYAADLMLGFLANRRGGGDINVNSFSKNYGGRGKYGNLRNDITRYANSILKTYMTGVVG